MFATAVLGDMGGPLRIGSIFQYATAHQLEKYLLPVLRAERACCFSLTENDAGSDVRGLRTTATPDGDGWRLTDRKRVVSGKSVSVRISLDGRRIITHTKHNKVRKLLTL